MAQVRRARQGGGGGASAVSLVPWFVLGVVIVWNISLLTSKTVHSTCLEDRSSLPHDNAGTRSSGVGGVGGAASTALRVASAPATPPKLQEALEGNGPVSAANWQWGPTIIVALGTKDYAMFLENWILSTQQLGLPMLVYALDAESSELCMRLGAPHRVLPGLDNMPEVTSYELAYARYRWIGAAFAREASRQLQRLPIDFLIKSDVDIVWRRDPTAYLQRFPEADWFGSTDCLSHEFELSQAKEAGAVIPRCGHVKGQVWGRAFNGGMYIMRNTPRTMTWLDTYATKLEEKEMKTPEGWVIDDQLAMTMMFEQGMVPAEEVEGAPRVVWVFNKSLRVHALPVLLFCNGHTGFVQKLPERHGVVPYMMHATFQLKGPKGKRDRFREYGLWYLDPPEYYEGPFLEYDNDVLDFVANYSPQAEAAGKAPSQMQLHLAGAAWQLAALRDAFALGWATNRTVIVAPMWCWCDLDQHPFTLEHCKVLGSDTQLPFRCPTDYLLDAIKIDKTVALDERNGSYRLPAFLDHPLVPRRVRDSRVTVHVVPAGSGDPPAGASPIPSVDLELPLGSTEAEVHRRLGPYAGAAVISLRGMRPGLFAGFSDASRSARFDSWWTAIAEDVDYCCAGADGWNEQSIFRYQRPPPLASLASSWKEWEYSEPLRPGWCDSLKEENHKMAAWGNHICQFGRKPA